MYQLMQKAGSAAFHYARQTWPQIQHWLVIAGKGNNAGDGYILACLAKQAGLAIEVYALAPDDKLTGDASIARQKWLDAGGSIQAIENLPLTHPGLLIDALFGTGLNRLLDNTLQELIEQINSNQLPVFSLDIASGLNANTGQPMPVAIKAHNTMTFVALKPGLVTAQGKTHCGEVVIDDLQIGEAFSKYATSIARLVTFEQLPKLPARDPYSHKASHGRLLCIGGNLGMPGAIRLCAEAALRTGAGLVKVLCHPDNHNLVLQNRPELMLARPQDITRELTWADAIVIGPGLGQDKWAQDIYQQLTAFLTASNKPLVLDADGLRWLARDPQLTLNEQNILTPHPGEAAALLQTTSQDIEQDRYQAIQALQHKYHCPVLLKGAGTLIQDQQQLWVCNDGNPGMASGGMGDVLAGVLAALLAQGMPARQAIVYGTCLHSFAADLSAQQNGQRGMLASDLYPFLSKLIN